MENRAALKAAQDEAYLEIMENIHKLGFVALCWFDPDRIIHIVVRSRKTLENPKKQREFWRQFFDNGVEDLDFS